MARPGPARGFASRRSWRVGRHRVGRSRLTRRCGRQAAGTRGAEAVTWGAPLAAERQDVGRQGRMQYTCVTCGEVHEGIPSLSAAAPLYYYSIPEAERQTRCDLDSDTCVVDEGFFFVRGCLEVPILGEREPFIWGVWVSLSRESFGTFLRLYDEQHRSHEGPFFGWLSAFLKGYPDTENLKCMVHLRDHGQRPLIELEPTDHPLAVEQRSGITIDRVGEILSLNFHDEPAA